MATHIVRMLMKIGKSRHMSVWTERQWQISLPSIPTPVRRYHSLILAKLPPKQGSLSYHSQVCTATLILTCHSSIAKASYSASSIRYHR